MKAILIVAAFCLAVSLPSKAQVLKRPLVSGVTVVKDSVVDGATKYISFFNSQTGITGASLTGVKASGSPSAYAILQVRTDTMPTAATAPWNDYVYPGTTKRDTLFFTNTSTALGYTWPIPVQSMNGMRFKVVGTGTAKIYLYGSLLLR